MECYIGLEPHILSVESLFCFRFTLNIAIYFIPEIMLYFRIYFFY